MSSEIIEQPGYNLEIPDQHLADFSEVTVTKVNEELPWKPPLEVSVQYADGTIIENVDATTPVFAFKSREGGELSVSIAAAGHIDSLHIKGAEAGSRFGYDNLGDMLADIAPKISPEVAQDPDVTSAFSIETGKPMGKEGIATMEELLADGVLTELDIAGAKTLQSGIAELNLHGSDDDKAQFIDNYAEEHADARIKFQIIRGGVIVPVVESGKRETTQLFMVFGPDGKGGKTLYTAAPGRFMPKHPNPKQHMDASGVINRETFEESATAWFDTVMLTGE